MSERLTALISGAQAKQRKQLWAALVAADPHPAASLECMLAITEHGVDGIELILPFNLSSFHSPVIQRASNRALKGQKEGVTLETICAIVADFRRARPHVPIIVSSYANRLHAAGGAAALERLASAGVDGLMLNDVSWESQRLWGLDAPDAPLTYVPAISATSSLTRVEQILALGRPLTLFAGHMGEDMEDKAQALERLQTISARELTPKAQPPCALIASMQIGTAPEAKAVAQFCDGILVGSAFVWLVEGRGQEMGRRLSTFAAQLRQAMD